MIVFPHANQQTMDEDEFLARWLVWFDGPRSFGKAEATDAVPRLHSAVGYQALLDQERGHGLDAFCRRIVRPPYRNTMQATGPFMRANAHVLKPATVMSTTGRNALGARLRAEVCARLGRIRANSALMVAAEAHVASDIDVERAGQIWEAVGTAPISTNDTSRAARPAAPSALRGRKDFVKQLVTTIAEEPFQPRYRGRCIGQPVVGWTNRLTSYFWPRPEVGLEPTAAALHQLEEEGRIVVGLLDDRSDAAQQRTVEWAERILAWGGVPQRAVTADIVRAVIRAALTREPGSAPMNSGWTKVAAFATAPLEDQDRADAIWDSRVSWSLVRRADGIFSAAGISALPDWFWPIGKVPGRGGTRWSQPVQSFWPNGYGRWSAHFAAADLIRAIRDELNGSGVAAHDASGSQVAWSIRAVEMVLFMDGY
ncbi:hypothetical protein [Neoroseomonas oryzicola]|uniref:Uncharacterized protein n=1 Tax=Neoroseomonas oryzicola TaxID=535904 RepID=A0A9X9WJH4_9PROT|nr:hypothetical protein [Neoroseomonas oryzicola]MBR0660484.1 hypothetical protein [Neoroseomonas oryzicola]NKE18252.1 hypothetical protein [Neoroseomonas oryzicola]